MNLKKISITVLVVISGFLSAQQAQLEKPEGIKANFSQKSIEAHQGNSQKKLIEFYEYLTLYSKEKDSKLKQQILANIYSLVSSKTNLVFDLTDSVVKFIQLPELLTKIENQGYQFEISEIESSKNISLYEWENSYNLKITKGKDPQFKNVTQTIIFEPIEKHFGNKTKTVWEIKLNEMLED